MKSRLCCSSHPRSRPRCSRTVGNWRIVNRPLYGGRDLRNLFILGKQPGGIRTHDRHLESATYRFLVARSAISPRAPVAHCPKLPKSVWAKSGKRRPVTFRGYRCKPRVDELVIGRRDRAVGTRCRLRGYDRMAGRSNSSSISASLLRVAPRKRACVLRSARSAVDAVLSIRSSSGCIAPCSPRSA